MSLRIGLCPAISGKFLRPKVSGKNRARGDNVLSGQKYTALLLSASGTSLQRLPFLRPTWTVRLVPPSNAEWQFPCATSHSARLLPEERVQHEVAKLSRMRCQVTEPLSVTILRALIGMVRGRSSLTGVPDLLSPVSLAELSGVCPPSRTHRPHRGNAREAGVSDVLYSAFAYSHCLGLIGHGGIYHPKTGFTQSVVALEALPSHHRRGQRRHHRFGFVDVSNNAVAVRVARFARTCSVAGCSGPDTRSSIRSARS